MPLATPLRPAGGSIAWLLDGAGTPQSFTSDALHAALTRRRDEHGGSRDRHANLPRARYSGVVYRIRAI